MRNTQKKNAESRAGSFATELSFLRLYLGLLLFITEVGTGNQVVLELNNFLIKVALTHINTPKSLCKSNVQP